MSSKTFRQITYQKRIVVVGPEEEFERWEKRLLASQYILVTILHGIGDNKKQFRIVGEKGYDG